MEKRNKLWRRRHQWRFFKSRMILMVANNQGVWDENGKLIQHPHWMDCAKQLWSFKYKTMRTPCSCALCRSEKYNRRAYKKESARVISEAEY